jgi:NhaP-type Na+/H+ or K+/H+ antiporter
METFWSVLSGILGIPFGCGVVWIIRRADDGKPVSKQVFIVSGAWLTYLFVLFLVSP